jgi:hypothetical protein
MSKLGEESAALESSFRPKRRRSALIAIALAMPVAGALYEGTRSPAAAAAPESVPTSQTTAPATQESQRWHLASAAADVGPGNAEPVLVGSP